MWTPRSIDVLKNGPKFVSVCVDFAEENRRIAIFGDRTIFIRRAVDFSFTFDDRFFDHRATHSKTLGGGRR